MNYKIGDKVKVRSLEWFNKNTGRLIYTDPLTISSMSQFCSKIVTISFTEYSDTGNVELYKIEEDPMNLCWPLDAFESILPGLVITIPEGYEFDNINNGVISLRRIIPVNFEEFDYVHSIYTDKLAVFNKLLVLRDIYRNGWIPNWEDASTKRDIEYANGRLIRNSCTNKSSVFSFQDHEIRNAFFNAFKEQLKEIKDLL